MTARVWLIANHRVPWSTGSDLKRTLEGMNVVVRPLQDEDSAGWAALIREIKQNKPISAIIWNQTPLLSARIPLNTRLNMLEGARKRRIPTIAFHLDRWWGLAREKDLISDPYFRCEWVFTADGHPNPWNTLGINHHWSPPGVAPFHCRPGTVQPKLKTPVGFVGSWRYYGHEEWKHREELIRFLRRQYRLRVRFWPERRGKPVRERDLNDLYASLSVIVGDSCLAPDSEGRPYTRFASDRIPETLGRGGFLLHPEVEGITDGLFPVATWRFGDWRGLKEQIDHFLAHPMERFRWAAAGAAAVTAWHTYDVRLRDILSGVGVPPADLPLWPTTVEAQRRSDGEAHHQAPQASPQEPVRAARTPGLPDARQGPRSQRQSPGLPDVPPGAPVQVGESAH